MTKPHFSFLFLKKSKNRDISQNNIIQITPTINSKWEKSKKIHF